MRNATRSAPLLALLICTGVSATDDPMRPVPRPGSVKAAPAVAADPAPRRDWVLSSTLVGEARRVAVINDRLVGIGDEVLGALVIGIDARSAQLRYAGREVVLHLGEHRTQQPARPQGRGGARQ